MTDANNAVRDHIKNAYLGIDLQRYAQEPAYVTALMARLDGLAWRDDAGAFVEFRTTIVNDRGPNSAENHFGADFAITLELVNDQGCLTKATIGQAKKGSTDKLKRSDLQKLQEQCQKMANRTRDYLVLEMPSESGGCPMLRLASKSNGSSFSKKLIRLDDYIIEHLIACTHGDKRNDFVVAVQQSDLKGLGVIVSGLDNDLNPEHASRNLPKGP